MAVPLRTALFVVDYRPGKGLGHKVRCGALADELTGRGWTVESIGWNEIPSCYGHDVAIVDGYFDDPESDEAAYLDSAREFGLARTFVRIQDKPTLTTADLLICGCAGAKPEMFADCGARKVLAGPEYALLRPEFRNYPRRVGSDVAVSDLRGMHGWDAQMLAARLGAAALVITYGGMRALEAACVGAPMVVIQENDYQALNVEGLTDFKPQPNGRNAPAAVTAWLDDASTRALRAVFGERIYTGSPEEAAAMLLEDPGLLAEMSTAGRALVDGLGCNRVADEIARLCA